MELTTDKLIERYESASDPPPLHNLREVDWSAASHAHGPATDTPALLRALMSHDQDDRDFACQLLFETVCHQGSIYSASVIVVPFLYNLLEADGPHNKQAVAQLIATIADGTPYFTRFENNPEETSRWEGILRKAGRSLQDEMVAGRIVAEDARRAVASRLDVLFRYLRDPEPEIRRSVAIALGRFPETAAHLLPDLEAAHRDEPDKYARATLEEVIRRLRNFLKR